MEKVHNSRDVSDKMALYMKLLLDKSVYRVSLCASNYITKIITEVNSVKLYLRFPGCLFCFSSTLVLVRET